MSRHVPSHSLCLESRGSTAREWPNDHMPVVGGRLAKVLDPNPAETLRLDGGDYFSAP